MLQKILRTQRTFVFLVSSGILKRSQVRDEFISGHIVILIRKKEPLGSLSFYLNLVQMILARFYPH